MPRWNHDSRGAAVRVAWDALVTNEKFGTSTAPAARSIAADPLIAA
jgi:hypothetical protein